MKLKSSIQIAATFLPAILAGSGGLRNGRRMAETIATETVTNSSATAENSSQTGSSTSYTTDNNPSIITNTPGFNYHVALSEENWTVFPGAGRIKILEPKDISNNTMGFGYLELLPGGIRELHWHPFSTEWGFITEGECRFTLMDNDGNYENGYAKKGDIWNFPTSFAHSIQGVDPDYGCKMALFFSAPYEPTVNDISISEMMTAFPRDVLEENLGAPADVIASFYQQSVSVSPGPFPPPEFPESTSPLKTSPIFYTPNGTCVETGDGGYLYMVRQDNFPGVTEMSGGYMHLSNGTLRDIHWHPNANEMQYVLNGTLKVGIYSIEGVRNTYTLNAGDVGFVPKGMAHYLEAIDGPADILLTFDSPSWTTQELSTMLAQVPSYITAASINTTIQVVDQYFPKATQDFFGDTFIGCPGH
jgi:oxalate decarboxylase